MSRTTVAAFVLLLAVSLAAAHAPSDQQLAELTAQLRKHPADARLYLGRGEQRRFRREWAKALEDYRRARELDPKLSAVDLATGLLMLDSGRPGRAVPSLDRYVGAEPDRADGLIARARAKVRLGLWLPAVEDQTRAISLFRGDDMPPPELYLDRARALEATGEPAHLDEAIAGLEEGITRLGRPVTLKRALARLRERRGDVEPADGDAQPYAGAPVEDPAPGAIGTVAAAPAAVLVDFTSTTRYLANALDPGVGLAWIAPTFDDSSWGIGDFGVGYEAGTGAQNLIRTSVPVNTSSVYTRTTFAVSDASAVRSLFLGADYDDGYAAWLNGVEVYRSPEMPSGALSWNTRAVSHESSNAVVPNYGAGVDVTARALAALRSGDNVLAIAVFNTTLPSSDLVLVPRLDVNRQAKLTRGPYLQRGTPTALVVRWRTDTATDSRVRLGGAPGHLTLDVVDPAVTTEHVVAVGGLEPSTTYVYAIGSSAGDIAGGDLDHAFTTGPPAGTAKPTRIWVIGDSGTADARPRAVRDAYQAFTGSRATDLWLMLGDNAYQSGTDAEYQAAVFDVYPRLLATSVLWPTLGNHDGISARSSSQSGPYYDIFTLPRGAEAGGVPSGTEAYYAFDVANIHFICLDSYDLDRSPGGAMLTWLAADLRATRQEWVIAFWHHPPYSKGSHDTDFPSESTDMREFALPILEDAGVDLVLSGHSHDYERSFLLDGHYGTSNTLTPAMKLDPGSGRVGDGGPYSKFTEGPAPHEGAVYAVAGSSGQIAGGALNHPAMFLSLNTLGSMVLDVEGKELHASFLDAAGAVRDQFTIRKGHNLPPIAVAGGDLREECASRSGAWVTFDGSASHDPDSTPGTSDDIERFEWFEDLGMAAERLVGLGARVTAQLLLGDHRITLRVTDRGGLVSTDEIVAR
ncbi:MAG TPA: metallophosphoesterase, partial [Verrucomicrobiae bacterium]|nr:metallophosphoesterase [Verrucomicrobiae bacterium]